MGNHPTHDLADAAGPDQNPAEATGSDGGGRVDNLTGRLPDAREIVRVLTSGDVLATDFADTCLAAIEAREPVVGAWQHLDPARLREQAAARDTSRRAGEGLGLLHGVPVGIKDNIDTADMPTEDGTPLHVGRHPREDAFLVGRLRDAGALIAGKTVTTEFAYFSPGRTRNPHDPRRTPGGSSSGSAAAVAAGMVPLAVGTQTNGSVIRPAAFCGIIGFKPSRGLISRQGVLQTSPRLDQVGVFARSVGDAALLAQALIGHDRADPLSVRWSTLGLVERALAEPPLPPYFGLLRSPLWDQVSQGTQSGFGELAEALGERCVTFDIGGTALEINGHHATVMQAEMAWSLSAEYQRGKDRMSERLKLLIETGQKVSAVDYQRSLFEAERLGAAIDALFEDCDVLMLPSALGSAPLGLESTGDPLFCSMASLLGLPAITLPLLVDDDGMPLGVQLVGRFREDARLLRAAQALVQSLANES